MYRETGLLFSYFPNFSQEVQHLEEFCRFQKTNSSLSDLLQTSTISEYDLGGEGDLFKAPEPIIEEPVMTAGISMISCGEDEISSQTIKVSDIESFENEQYLTEIFYECKKDMMAKTGNETPLSEVLDIKIPIELPEEKSQISDEIWVSDGLFQKSVSSGCLSSIRPNFLDFPGLDFGAFCGMRRAFSEGDITNLGNGNMGLLYSPLDRPLLINTCISEDRKEKLSRYRNKKSRRNFGRKIKYACRKALADNQPRIRGRFAKTEEHDILKKLQL